MVKPNITAEKLRLSRHAIERAMERFGCKNEQDAIKFVKSRFNKAKYIGETTCEQGQRGHAYCYDNIAIYVSLDLQHIKSVVELDSHGHYDGLKNKIEQMYLKEFRKMDRFEQARINKLKYLTYKNEAEIASLKYRAFKTRSANVKNECEKRIVELHNEIKQCEIEIKEAELKKRQIFRAIGTVV